MCLKLLQYFSESRSSTASAENAMHHGLGCSSTGMVVLFDELSVRCSGSTLWAYPEMLEEHAHGRPVENSNLVCKVSKSFFVELGVLIRVLTLPINLLLLR